MRGEVRLLVDELSTKINLSVRSFACLSTVFFAAGDSERCSPHYESQSGGGAHSKAGRTMHRCSPVAVS